MARKPGTLTAKQRRFVAEFPRDLNATQAAIRAGYSPATAVKQASRLLKNVDISAAVEAARAKQIAGTEITVARVLAEVEQLAFSRVSNYRVDDAGNLTVAPGVPEAALQAVSSIKRRPVTVTGPDGSPVIRYEVEFKLWDKPGTLKLAGRHVGLFPDRVERPVDDADRQPTVLVLNGTLPASVDDQGTLTTTLVVPGN